MTLKTRAADTLRKPQESMPATGGVRAPRGSGIQLLGAALSPEKREGVLVDLFEEVVELRGGVELVVAMPASVAVRPEQDPGARGSVLAKLGDRQVGPRTRPALPQRPTLNERDGGGPSCNLQANLVPGLGGDALIAESLDLGDRQVRHAGVAGDHEATLVRFGDVRHRGASPLTQATNAS
jgi:hypothetical protein